MVQRKSEPASPALLPGELFSGAQWDLSIHGEEPRESVPREKRERCSPGAEQCSARRMLPLGFFGNCSCYPTALFPDVCVQAVCAGRGCKGADKSCFVLRAVVKHPQLHHEGGDAQCRTHLIPRWASEQAAAFVPFGLPSLCPPALINLICMLSGRSGRQEPWVSSKSSCLSILGCSLDPLRLQGAAPGSGLEG